MQSRRLVRAAAWGAVAMLAVQAAHAQDAASGTPSTAPPPADVGVVVVTDPVEPVEPTPLTGPQSVPQNRIASDFRPMLGNDAEAIVQGLRTGSEITLTETTPGALPGDPPETTIVTIDSPTGPLGNGEVRHTLDLARFQLAQVGIAEPTASELQAALTGGAIPNPDGTVTEMPGVLAMRADGMGWGSIAHEMGTTMGALKNGTAVAAPLAAPAPAGGDATVVDDGGLVPTPNADDAATKGREHITDALGSGAGASHGRDAKVTDGLGNAGGHGRSDSHVTNALGEMGDGGHGRGNGIVDGLGGGGNGGAKHVVNAMGDAHGGGRGAGSGIVDGLGGSMGGGGGRGAAAVTDALGSSGGGGFGGGHGGGGNGGGHGRGRH